MRLCGKVSWCRIGWLIVVINLLLLPNYTFSQNLPPVLGIGVSSQHAEVGSVFSYTIPSNAFTDENGDVLNYSVGTLPTGLSFDNVSRQISGTPTTAGTTVVNVTADDGMTTSTSSFTINVHPTGSTYAAFTMNTQMGCGYRQVSFTNLSKNAATFEWVMGNGDAPNTSIVNPVVIYTKPGEYTVTLTINKGLPTQSVTSEKIRIYPRPIAAIADVVNPGCEPAEVTLKSNSIAGYEPQRTINGQVIGAISGGAIEYNYWYFFDDHEAVYNTNPPSITIGGFKGAKYNVLMEITDINGCQGSKTRYNLFEVADKPNAHFIYDKSDDCSPSLTTLYDISDLYNSSIKSSTWKIDGLEIDDKNDTVAYEFTTSKTYTISLQSTSTENCVSDIYTGNIKFNANNAANFIVDPVYCLGDTVSFNATASTGAISYSWDIGNNGSIESTNFSYDYLFTSPGSYDVKLKVNFDDDCSREIIEKVNIDRVDASFNYSTSYSCNNKNYPVDFQNTSTTYLGKNIVSRNWYEVNGTVEDLISTSNSFTHTFNGSGSKTIKLEVVSADGCKGTITREIILNQPTVNLSFSGSTVGCFASAGATNFSANLLSDYETATDYFWNFGDGNTAHGANTSHNYASAGNYNVSVQVTTNTGCDYNETRNSVVRLADEPVISNVNLIQDVDQCYSSGVQLQVSYTAGVENLTFETPSGIETIVNPGVSPYLFFYEFPNIGTYEIDVTADQYGCFSSAYNVPNLVSNEPKALFNTSQNTFCSEPYEVTFTNQSSYSDPLTTFTWDFGDGTSTNSFSPTHSYSAIGNYNVTLTVDNGTCSDQYSEEINIFSFNNSTGIIGATNNTGCAPLTVNFTQNITSRLSGNYSIDQLLWDFNNDGSIDDTTNASGTTQYTYLNPGQYSVRLIVKSANGACDYVFTESDLVQASGPIVNFTHSPATVCLGTTVNFTNNSTQPVFDSSTITDYQWEFGDGTGSDLENPSHTYTSDSKYTVSLTVTDSEGCSSTLEKADLFEIIPFEPAFDLSDTIICNGSEITFINESSGNATQYQWDFDGNGIDKTTTDLSSVSYTFNTPGTYNVVLTAVVSTGCTKTVNRQVRVIDAIADFTASSTDVGCAPAFAYFNPAANANDVHSYYWTFGDGNTSTERSPRNYYVNPGDYTVSLTITFKGSCNQPITLTRNNYIKAQGAAGKLNYDNTPACAPNPVLFSVSDMNQVSYVTWDFGTGEVKTDTVSPSSPTYIERSYTYDTLGYRTPKVILSDLVCGEYAYENEVKGDIYTSYPPIVDFTVDFDTICRGVPIQFTDLSTSPDSIYGLTSWKWYFHSFDSDSSSIRNPKFAYPDMGVYDPELIVSNALGCSDTLQKTDFINIYGNNQLTSDFTIDDALACPLQPINFTSQANGGANTITKWEWDLGFGFFNGTTSQQQSYNDTLAGQTINIIHRVTDDKFCINSTIRTVEINKLQAAFGYEPQPVLNGGFVDFSDSSTTDFGTTITQYNWTFQNATPNTSTQSSPKHVGYSSIANGNLIQLTVTNSNSCTSTVTEFIDVLNNPPVVDTFTITLIENSAFIFKRNEFKNAFSDVDQGQIINSVRIESTPVNGSFFFNDIPYVIGTKIPYSQITQLKFIPTPDWNGSTSFTWNGFDGYDWADVAATVYVEVMEEPAPPILSDIVFNVPEDAVIRITKQDFIDHIKSSSIELDSIRIISNLSPNIGTLTFNGDVFTAPLLIPGNKINDSDSVFIYTPTPGFNGELSFEWNAYDGYNFSLTSALVRIIYSNTPPALSDIEYNNVKQGQYIEITKAIFDSNYSDIDNYDLPVTLFITDITNPSDGTFKYNGVNITNNFSANFNNFSAIRFWPNNTFEGFTSATWGISDGTDTSFAQILLNYVNTKPVAHNFDVYVYEDVPYSFTIADFNNGYEDEDKSFGDQIESIRITSLPTNGTLTYNGSTVTLPLEIDRDYIGQLAYLTNLNYNGSDSFIYNLNDGTEWADKDSLVNIQVIPVNDAPNPYPDFYSMLEDQILSGVNVGLNDEDIDDNKSVLTFSVADEGSAGENGTISLSTKGDLTYTPDHDFNGSVSFIYTVFDDDLAGTNDTVYINIDNINDAPIARKDSFFIYEDDIAGTFKCLANDTDVDNDAISLVSVEDLANGPIQTEYGSLDWNSTGELTFSLAFGLDTLQAGDRISLNFNYKIYDVWEAYDSSVFVITILGRNDPPTANADEFIFNEGDISVSSGLPLYHTLLDNDSDPEDDVLTVQTVNGGNNQNITFNFGLFNWQPNGSWTFNENFEATDSLYQGEEVTQVYPYAIADAASISEPSTITLKIIGINDAPIATDNFLMFTEEVISIDINTSQQEALLSNDNDIDGDVIRVTSVVGIHSGSETTPVGIITWNSNGSYTYVPNRDSVQQLAAGQEIIDSLQYYIVDDFGATASAYLIIKITGENDKPFANDDYIEIFEDTHKTEVEADNGLLKNDGDIDHDPIVVAVNGIGSRTQQGLYGTLSWDSTGAYTFITDFEKVDPLSFEQRVTDVFSYLVNDPSGDTDEAKLYITLIGENDAPVAENHYEEMFEQDAVLTINERKTGILAEDSDIDDGINFGIIQIDQHKTTPVNGKFGILNWNYDGTFIYTLNAGADTLSESEVVIDSFRYIIQDIYDSTAFAWFYIEITGNNDAPEAHRDTLRITEDEIKVQPTWSLLDNDLDTDGDAFELFSLKSDIVSPTPTTFAEFNWENTGYFIYNRYVKSQPKNGLDTLAFDDVILDSIEYVITDQYGVTSTSYLWLEITGVNDAPSTGRDLNFLSENTTQISSTNSNYLLKNDFEIDRRDSVALLNVMGIITDSVSGNFGYLRWNFDGSYTYFNNFDATDSLAQSESVHDLFPYTVIDKQGATSTDTLDITIFGVNDRPVAVNDTIIFHEDQRSVEIHPENNGVLWNDYDVDGDVFQVLVSDADSIIIAGNYGVLTLRIDGSADYILNSAIDTLYQGEIVTDKFTYKIIDDNNVLSWQNATIVINIEGNNDQPVAVDDFVSINEDVDSIYSPISNENALLFHDEDIDGDLLQVKFVNNDIINTQGNFGILNWDSTGAYTYITNRIETDKLAFGDTVLELFTYITQDPFGGADTALLKIEIIGVNDPPVAMTNSYFTLDTNSVIIAKDSINDILDNDYDVDGEISQITLIDESPAYTTIGQCGTLTWNPDGSFVYQPDSALAVALRPEEMKIDEFVYTLTDELNASDTSKILFYIRGINNAPYAYNDTILLFEDDLLGLPDESILLNDHDPDRDTLFISKIENDTLGVFTGLYGEIFWTRKGDAVFTPNRAIIDQLGAGTNSIEEYTYTIVDEGGKTSTADLVVYIIGENDGIIAYNDTATLDEDSYVLVDVLANDIDPDNNFEGNWDKTPVAIITPPLHGTAHVNTATGVISYFPEKNFFGTDSIKYQASDDEGAKASAWVYLTVNSINDAPKATNLILKTDMNVPINFNIFKQVNDIDDGVDPNSFELFTAGINLTQVSDSIFTYTPVEDFIGRDEFIYSLADFEGERAYVIVTVLIPDEGEGAQDDYVVTSENTAIEIRVLENDTLNGFIPNPLSVDILVYAANGQASYDPVDHHIKYEPSRFYNGFDSLTYIVESKEGVWDLANVYITVQPINSPINAEDDAVTSLMNQIKIIEILRRVKDEDNGVDTSSVIILQQPQFGTISFNYDNGLATYTPNEDYIGNDYFTYRVCDLDAVNTSCDSATISILVKSKFDGVNAKNDNYSTDENTLHSMDDPHPIVNDEGDVTLESFTVITAPQHGNYTLEEVTKVIDYTPFENYFGPDWITYQVCNEDTSCDFAEINIWVNELNTPPIANNDTFIVTENTRKRLAILSNDYDIDGTLNLATLDTVSGAGPKKGDLIIDRNTGTVVYIPSTNADVDYFTYTICDDEGLCSQATVTIIVDLGSTILYNQVTYEDTPDTFEIAPVLKTYNFYFDVQNVVEVVGPEIGVWEIIENNTKIVYTPQHDSTGSDYYNLILYSDGIDSVDLRVTVSILPVNDAPVAVQDTVTWTTGSDTTIITFNDILKNDFDVDRDPILLTESVIENGDSLHVIFNADSTITIWADTILWCDAWFTYEIKDPDGESAIGYVLVIPELDGIFAADDSMIVDENSTTNMFDVIANDSFKDNQRCTIDSILIITQPVNGIAAATDDNFIQYRPTDHYYGIDSLQYTLIDRWNQTDTAWVIITVTQRNQAPVAVNDLIVNEFGATLDIPVLNNDYDPDPDGHIETKLTHIALGSEPTNGTISFDTLSGMFTYTPNEFICEGDQFSYTIIDNEGDSATATVTITLPAEAPLNPVTDTIRTYPSVPVEFNVLINDQGYFLPIVDNFTQPFLGNVQPTGDSTFIYYPDPEFTNRDSMTYNIVSPCGNSASAYVIFMIEELRVPEIITPNGDSKNDVLIIDGIEYFPESLLEIYNRYGHIVYQSKGYKNDWDGYSNQGSLGGNVPLPTGTYMYTLTYNQGKNKQAGTIYIFR